MERYTSGEHEPVIEIEDREVTGKAANPRFFSLTWFKLFFKAFAFHKYTPQMWGAWHLSTASTIGSIFGVYKPVWLFITVKLPWLAKALVFCKEMIFGFFKMLWVGLCWLLSLIFDFGT